MRITYVLPRPELGGGNKVIFQHADLLLERGHQVTVIAEGETPEWVRFDGVYHDSRRPLRLGSQDLVIATFWTTIERVLELELGPAAHFCQGYEGSHSHYRAQLPEIEAAYARALPSLTVTPYLGELLARRFGTASRVVPPPLDRRFRPRPRRRPRRRPWIVVPGVYQAPVKDVPTALRAITLLRARGVDCRVLRFSTVPITDEERALLDPDRYLAGVHPETIAEELRRCDLLLMPSEPEEGFGLPLLEAMACKVPAVASRIPSTEYMAEGAAALVPVGDAAAFAAAAAALLSDPAVWRRARRRGARAARRFAPRKVTTALEDAVQWASRWTTA